MQTPLKKPQLHCRNKHRNGYDFAKLIKILPELSRYVNQNSYGNLSIDFADPLAVKLLNKALLFNDYQINYWDIPDGFLCPPIPGRADYIHYLADLLAQDSQNSIPTGKQIRVLDIGVGANVIYPIIGCAEYGWSFVGSDINPVAIKVALLITQANRLLKNTLQCRLQKDSGSIFKHIIKPNEFYVLTLCNPPFHASAEGALVSTQTKLKKLGKLINSTQKTVLNFGGQHAELWCQGGERAFISNMINESTQYKTQCLWFTSLVSKKETLSVINKKLKQAAVVESRIIPMAQGQKVSRFVAWTFFNQTERQQLLSKSHIKQNVKHYE
ncbi:23S rRNA (adenine(1618)-N(6))-methyltransferase RlmF [Gilliamella sp. Occ4-3]|uniref:23S rRNA (adenine(1618)-N(6))-methyltransferase RlmF n=1 Tax=Gilliamella sp. Occ4-3 TaxID=3120254 RepID=UPI00080E27C1|nr:23S rRNA (adenine(1618)-N(6))-methyltransferase RlmF [Gilliamella apicola]OCG79420.1 23S rRNA (adenine(1618)-N(6))-methyltransferase [Gilliamella apicola]